MLAAERGKAGERYLAGGYDADVKTIATMIEQVTGKRPAEGLPPLWVLRIVASIAGPLAHLTGKAPMITNELLDDAAGGNAVFDCSKARRELGLEPKKPDEVVREAVRWALFMGWLPPALAERVRATSAPEAGWPAPRA